MKIHSGYENNDETALGVLFIGTSFYWECLDFRSDIVRITVTSRDPSYVTPEKEESIDTC